MKKFLLSAAIIATVSLSTAPAFSSPVLNTFNSNIDKDKTNKDISIVSDRKSGEITVRFKASKEASATITVLDETGKVVLKQTNQLSAGNNNLPLVNSLKLAEGTYTVHFVTNQQTYSSSFLFWK